MISGNQEINFDSKTSRQQENKTSRNQDYKQTIFQENNISRKQDIKKTIFLDSAEIHKHGPNMA